MDIEKVTYFFLHVGNGEVMSTPQEQTYLFLLNAEKTQGRNGCFQV